MCLPIFINSYAYVSTVSRFIRPKITIFFCNRYLCLCTNNAYSGAKDDWDFRISDLIKNPDETDIVVNFGEVRRAQLVKSTLLTSTLVPLGSFKNF